MTVEEIKQHLRLMSHPTRGLVAETYRSKARIPSTALPGHYEASRPMGSVLYILVSPAAQLRLHRIRSDQMYHHYLGSPLEILLLYGDGTHEVRWIGGDLRKGAEPQLFIPGDTFHISRLPEGAEYALLGSSESPGAESPDVELGMTEELVADYPDAAELLRAFVATHSTEGAWPARPVHADDAAQRGAD